MMTVPERSSSPTKPSSPRGLGGTDASSILGLNRFVSPYECYLQKLGLIEKLPAGEAAWLGNILEPILLARRARERGVAIVTSDPESDEPPWRKGVVALMPDGQTIEILDRHGQTSVLVGHDAARLLSLHHREYGQLLTFLDAVECSPDDFTPLAIVDVKTIGPYVEPQWGTPGTDELPIATTLQFQHYDTNLRSHDVVLPWHVVAYFRGPASTSDFVFYPSETLSTRLLAAELRFWDRLIRRDPPPIDESEATKHALNRRWQEDVSKTLVVEPGTPLETLARQYREAQLEIDAATRLKASAANALRLGMRDAAKLQGQRWSVSWKRPKGSKRTSWRAALTEFRNRFLDPACPWVPQEILAALDESIANHTTTTEPERRFYPKLDALDALLEAAQPDAKELTDDDEPTPHEDVRALSLRSGEADAADVDPGVRGRSPALLDA
jgi:predicted phage-related endonuclease